MQVVRREILDLLKESSCGGVEVGAVRSWERAQYLAGESRSQQGTWKYLEGTWKYLNSKALEGADLINWSASLRGLREHLKKHTVDNLII